MFTLSFDAQSVREIIMSHGDRREISGTTLSLIQSKGEVVYDFGQALVHFGFDPKTSGLKLADLIHRWLSEGPTEEKAWINELCEELLRAMRSTPAKPVWALILSGLYPNWWFYPVVAHQRIKHNGGMQFDIYMYRVPGALPARTYAIEPM
jgi:hypothetical protein